jgi:hypothetical protein
MLYSQLQNGFEQGLFGVLPFLFVWAAIFLFLARKKMIAVIALGIAVGGFSMQAAISAFIAENFILAAVWVLLPIVGIAFVNLITQLHANPSVKSEVGQD